jgi:hypothetical protein
MESDESCKLYSPEWGKLSMEERVERWMVLREGATEKEKAGTIRDFLLNFSASYRTFDKKTIENLLFELRETSPQPEFWTEEEKARIFEGVLAVYNMPPECLVLGAIEAKSSEYLNN